ncbi:MAG: universal stress protein [Candidatus Rokubacteria bacterium]|nr:universal stress protein [Candidatus Rokubacteria bacterium]
MTRLATLLFPTDFSPAAQGAWPVVEALATASGGTVVLLHIMPEVPEDPRTSPGARARLEAGYRRRAEESVATLLAESSLPRARVRTILCHGVAQEEIVNHAHSVGADVVVMGTHGWSGLLRWALGSVAHHVIQAAPCPVLTVGPPSQKEVYGRVA